MTITKPLRMPWQRAGPAPVTAKEAVAVLAVLDAARVSATEDRTVHL